MWGLVTCFPSVFFFYIVFISLAFNTLYLSLHHWINSAHRRPDDNLCEFSGFIFCDPSASFDIVFLCPKWTTYFWLMMPHLLEFFFFPVSLLFNCLCQLTPFSIIFKYLSFKALSLSFFASCVPPPHPNAPGNFTYAPGFKYCLHYNRISTVMTCISLAWKSL